MITVDLYFGYHYRFDFGNGRYEGYYQSIEQAKENAKADVDRLFRWIEENSNAQ